MSYRPDSAVTVICIHYSATPIENEYPYSRLEADHKRRGFKEGGYHIYFPRNGGRVYGRDLTQPGRFEMGAQSKGENDSSIGLCFEGGVTLADRNTGFDSRTPSQTKEMIAAIKELKLRFPSAIIKGHRDMPGAATQCPGFDATAWWDGVMATPTKPNRFAAIIAAILGIFGKGRK
jgi:N-acetylmuramoyl-L-alanine amidase